MFVFIKNLRKKLWFCSPTTSDAPAEPNSLGTEDMMELINRQLEILRWPMQSAWKELMFTVFFSFITKNGWPKERMDAPPSRGHAMVDVLHAVGLSRRD